MFGFRIISNRFFDNLIKSNKELSSLSEELLISNETLKGILLRIADDLISLKRELNKLKSEVLVPKDNNHECRCKRKSKKFVNKED